VLRRYATPTLPEIRGISLVEVDASDADFHELLSVMNRWRAAVAVGKLSDLDALDVEDRDVIRDQLDDPESRLNWRLYRSTSPVSELLMRADQMRVYRLEDPMQLLPETARTNQRFMCFIAGSDVGRELTLEDIASPSLADEFCCLHAVRQDGAWRVGIGDLLE
jgi:hypothetical protein